MIMQTKIAVIGSRVYTNNKKIKDFIFRLKEKYKDDVVIVSGGQPQGADGYAKKYALEFDMNYKEFPPAHYNWNMHCVLPATEYKKPYYVSNYIKRNKQLAEYSDIIVAFMPEGQVTKGTSSTLEHAVKKKKLIKIMS
tara:strand:+ start:1233 stop:1646 length:414 start_codon:yes stop_codon:yes gene_type:complete